MIEILNLLNPWWFGKKVESGIERPKYLQRLEKSLNHKRALLMIGSRRVGKTTILHQMIAKLTPKISGNRILYALLDHPQLSSVSIMDLLELYRKHFVFGRSVKVYLFLDEIQYVKDWEQEVKSILDTENVKIFLSGSASSELLLKSSYLTGRIEKLEVSPLDFDEYLAFTKVKISEVESYKYERYTDDYLKTGGYPEYVLEKDPGYLSDLVNTILYKDIVSIYQLKNPDLLRDLFLLLADRVGSQTTFSKLASVLSLKNDTVKEYVYYLKNIFLLTELPRYTYSRSHRIYGPKKFYLDDNGLLLQLSGGLNLGQAFEQTLFNYLKYTGENIGFYYEKQKEIDFVLKKGEDKEFWEAKYEIGSGFESKLESYIALAQNEKAKRIVFVTKNTEKLVKRDDIQVLFVPLWKLLTGKKSINL